MIPSDEWSAIFTRKKEKDSKHFRETMPFSNPDVFAGTLSDLPFLLPNLLPHFYLRSLA